MDKIQKQRATEYAMYQALETLFPPGKCRTYNKNLLCRLFLAWQEQSENSKTQMLDNCDKAAEEIEKKLPKSFFKGPATIVITPDAVSGGLSNHLDSQGSI